METTTPIIMGLGYEGLSIDEYIQSLVDWDIQVVVDVRLNPISRKRGFSKTKLSAAISDAGMTYLHRRVLGNPKDNRAGFSNPTSSAGYLAHKRYREILASEDGYQAVKEISDLAQMRRIALLCFEADEHCCHRKLIRDAVLSEIASQVVTSH